MEDAANGKTEKGCCEVRAWTGECSPGFPNYGGGAAAEKCPNPDCEGGTRPNGEGGWDMCPDCLEAANADGGGAAVAAGARGADLEGDEPSETEAVARVKAVMKAGRDAGSGVFDSNSVFRFGTHGVAALLNFLERDGWEVIHTGVYAQPQKWIQAEAELEDQPTPYARAFRERVCPVPEFPSIRETAHEAIIEGGCCIQCGLPNNSETVLFHSCQAGAPADPTCPNTGHKFSHCDCDLGIEKEES